MAIVLRIDATTNPAMEGFDELLSLSESDMREILRRVDRRFREHEIRLFASEGVLGGTIWAPLSKPYATYKKKVRPGRKKLVFDGDLRKSFTTMKSPNHVREYTWRPVASVTVGSSDPVGAYHGPGPLHNPKLPVRDPMAHTQQQQDRYLIPFYEMWKKSVRRFFRVARQFEAFINRERLR